MRSGHALPRLIAPKLALNPQSMFDADEPLYFSRSEKQAAVSTKRTPSPIQHNWQIGVFSVVRFGAK